MIESSLWKVCISERVLVCFYLKNVAALAIYPPLDKDRLKYYHTPSGRIQMNPQSFGRCELIQSFILNKSGHMYTAKEIRGCIQLIERNDIPKSTRLVLLR